MSGVFDISSQSKQKLKSKQRSKLIVKIYANLLHAYDFLCDELLMSLRGENLDRGQYPFQPIHIRKFGSSQSLWDKALVNEDTLLQTLCCPCCFLGCANWETFVADAKCFWTKSETFFVSRTQNLCPQQMLPARGNGETFVSATMCPEQCVFVCQGHNYARAHKAI